MYVAEKPPPGLEITPTFTTVPRRPVAASHVERAVPAADPQDLLALPGLLDLHRHAAPKVPVVVGEVRVAVTHVKQFQGQMAVKGNL